MAWSLSGQEFLDLVHDELDVAHKRIVLVAGELDEASTGDVLGEVAATLDRGGHVVGAMQYEGRRRDCRERRPHVDACVPARKLLGTPGVAVRRSRRANQR